MTKTLHKFSFLLAIFAILLMLPLVTQAGVAERVPGRILLDVHTNGEAWYVLPSSLERYYLGRPQDAFDIMRFLSLGITNADLERIPKNTDTHEGDMALRERLSGRILLQVEGAGEAWYVYPGDLKRYYLGRPADAFDIMRTLGLGITPSDLSTITVATGSLDVGGSGDGYASKTVSTSQGSFEIEVIEFNRDEYKMITDTGNTSDCTNNCTAHTLEEYVNANGADFGIHGSYFCPPDYSSCANETNSYLPPVFNSVAGKMINSVKLRWHTGPLVAVDKNGGWHYYHRSEQFGYSVDEWESKTGQKLQAAIANYPALVDAGNIVVHNEGLASNQTTKAVRGGIGFNNEKVYLVIAKSASVPDLAYIMQSLGASWAMNLDGGASAHLYYGGEYKYQGGRSLPNAILFKKK